MKKKKIIKNQDAIIDVMLELVDEVYRLKERVEELENENRGNGYKWTISTQDTDRD